VALDSESIVLNATEHGQYKGILQWNWDIQWKLRVSTNLQSIPTGPEKSIGVCVFTGVVPQGLCIVPLEMLTAVTVWERLEASIHLTSKSECSEEVTFWFHLLNVWWACIVHAWCIRVTLQKCGSSHRRWR